MPVTQVDRQYVGPDLQVVQNLRVWTSVDMVNLCYSRSWDLRFQGLEEPGARSALRETDPVN